MLNFNKNRSLKNGIPNIAHSLLRSIGRNTATFMAKRRGIGGKADGLVHIACITPKTI